MRIAKIKQVYVGEQKIEKKKRCILLTVDKDGNMMKTVFSWEQDRNEALQYLQKRIPELYVGNLTELEKITQ